MAAPLTPDACGMQAQPVTLHMVPLPVHATMWVLTLLAILLTALLMPSKDK